MHHIYHTEGLILGSKNSGETGRYFYIFTRDLGMVYATASGVRKLSSKLRFVLQDFSYVKIDLVQGRDFWRLTSASKMNSLEQISKKRETLEVLFNISNLLKRLLAGVETNKALFDDIVEGLLILEKMGTLESSRTALCADLVDDNLKNIEALIILRILDKLGYIGGDETVQNMVKSTFEPTLMAEVSKSRRLVLSHINKALKETHL